MATIYDINPAELIKKASEELKKAKGIQFPEWARFVRTGVHKQRMPEMDDWWFIRAATILRKVYTLGPIGVNKLRTKFGGKKNRGTRPEKFYKGSGKIIRVILQQLTEEGLIRDVEKGFHKGKIVTPKGRSFMDKLISSKIETQKMEEAPKEKPKVEKKEALKEETPKEKPKVEKKEVPKEEAPKEKPKVEKKEAPKEEAPKEKPVEEKKEAPKDEPRGDKEEKA